MSSSEADMDTKQWRCKNGHVLGTISWDGDKVPQLLLYRHAVDLRDEKPAEVDVIGPLQGRMKVRCDAEGCEAVQVWEVSEAVLWELLSILHGKKSMLIREQLAKRFPKSKTDLGEDAKESE